MRGTPLGDVVILAEAGALYEGLECRVQGSGIRVQGLELKVEGVGFRV